MPKFISECGDVLLVEVVSHSVGAMLGSGPLMLLLCVQVCLIVVLKSLSRAFMSGEVIFLSVVFGTGVMGVGSEVMVLSRNLL